MVKLKCINSCLFITLFLILIVATNGKGIININGNEVLKEGIRTLLNNEEIEIHYEGFVNTYDDLLGKIAIEGTLKTDLLANEQKGTFDINLGVVDLNILQGTYSYKSGTLVIELPYILDEPIYYNFVNENKEYSIEDIFNNMPKLNYKGRESITVTNIHNKTYKMWINNYGAKIFINDLLYKVVDVNNLHDITKGIGNSIVEIDFYVDEDTAIRKITVIVYEEIKGEKRIELIINIH
ncbi:hypothetical protein EDC18_1163 [Natranaerovirga pectinivora]|uniref:Uncharacterized protein n=1 Tax=Natranaerovirga pectinivora TaxID=682400 RepID=A0A4R3MD34_9FIRM|nr:hypothetical protein [Natranaerovirga pectinivora]TCT11644.1 hypothetical protein EDC18_1163 [Natranaerovirga pectinivora]